MTDKNLSAEEQLAELLKMMDKNNEENRKIFYAWCKERELYWRNLLKNKFGDKIPVKDIDKIFDDANNYDLAELVETENDYSNMSKAQLEELLALLKKAFEDVEGFEPDESEVQGFDYDSLYSGWEDVYSKLEEKIENIENKIKAI